MREASPAIISYCHDTDFVVDEIGNDIVWFNQGPRKRSVRASQVQCDATKRDEELLAWMTLSARVYVPLLESNMAKWTRSICELKTVAPLFRTGALSYISLLYRSVYRDEENER